MRGVSLTHVSEETQYGTVHYSGNQLNIHIHACLIKGPELSSILKYDCAWKDCWVCDSAQFFKKKPYLISHRKLFSQGLTITFVQLMR